MKHAIWENKTISDQSVERKQSLVLCKTKMKVVNEYLLEAFLLNTRGHLKLFTNLEE